MTLQCSSQARLLAIVASVAVSAVTFSPSAHADPLQDANRLLRQGQPARALEMVDRFLASKPKDAQARFLKGLILTEMNRQADAVVVFMRLTEDYPELPEPYNNLAVIYAQQKQYDKAKHALEMAIRTHPAYATAHENLGDIYARLASQAYDKALQIDSSNTSAQTKLAMIRDLMSASRNARSSVPARGGEVGLADAHSTVIAESPRSNETSRPVEAARPVVVEPAKAGGGAVTAPTAAPAVASVGRSLPSVAAPAPTAPAPAAPVVPTAPAAATAAVEKAAEKVSPVGTAVKAETPAARPAPAQAEVIKAVESWAAAWSRKDVRAYLTHYSRDFKTPGGQSLAAWEAERRQRIDKPGRIQVTVENLRVDFAGDQRATVRFRQNYRSAGFKSSTGKTLEMVRRDGRWLIQQERVGS